MSNNEAFQFDRVYSGDRFTITVYFNGAMSAVTAYAISIYYDETVVTPRGCSKIAYWQNFQFDSNWDSIVGRVDLSGYGGDLSTYVGPDGANPEVAECYFEVNTEESVIAQYQVVTYHAGIFKGDNVMCLKVKSDIIFVIRT